MNTHKAFILGVALLSTIGVKAQFAIDDYKAVFTSSPQHVPTTKTPDAPLAGNGDIGITMGGTPDKLCFYIGKNDFWGKGKWAITLFFGVMYMLAEYGTFKMANNIAFNKLNAPDLEMIVAGAIISAIGMLVGSLWNKKHHNQKNSN